ncbi:hypothetical protein [Pseudobutyrivibrio sp. LB2011]|uniref:hypothetical protein n=1 Tax=Pseudobutyrivibrio sp. LB2011 TaxID=1408312 RepID=UPI0005D21927|nr:hypothetical protein [Pseudobutyrivibrio sp. LB2011]
MKKNVVKAMSVGLSAITIASSLSVPVLADELDTSANDAQQTTEDAGEVAPVDEQKESTTPVTDYIEGVAKEIAPATDTSEDAEEEEFQYGSGAMVEEDEDDLSEIDKHLKNSSDALYELADGVEAEKAEAEENEDEANVEDELADDNKDETVNEKEVLGTVDVENANEAAKQAKQTAENSETKASTSANNADAAATKALNTATQEDIDAAKTALDTAKTDLKQAQEDAKAAEDAVQDAVDKLDAVLTENGLKVVTKTVDEETGEETESVKSVSEEDLDNLLDDLLKVVLDEEGNPVTDKDFLSLNGPAKEAILEAYNALLKAREESATAAGELEVAQEAVTKIENSALYKMAKQQEVYDNAETTEQDKDIAKAALAQLGFENYLETQVPGYVPGSYTGLSWYAQDINKNDFYRAFYKVKNEKGEEVIVEAYVEYSVSDTADGKNFSEASYKLVHSEVRTTDPTPATPDKWYTADGKEFVAGDSIVKVGENEDGFYAIDTAGTKEEAGEEFSDENATKAGTYYKLVSKCVGYEEKTVTESETYEYTVTKTKHGNNAQQKFSEAVVGAKSVLEQLADYEVSNVSVQIVVYGKGKDANTVLKTITVNDINGTYSCNGWGSIGRYEVVYSYDYETADYDKPIYKDYVLETVVEEKENTEPQKEYINWTYDPVGTAIWLGLHGWDVTKIEFELIESRYGFYWNYYYVTETPTKTLEVTSKNLYEAEKYIEKVPGTPEKPGDPYTVFVSDENSVHSVSTSDTAKAKSAYEEKTSTLTEKTTASENAAAKVKEIEGTKEAQGILGKVVSAVKEVLKLKSVSGIANSQLTTIAGIVNTADANYNAAVAKKAANDAAAAAASAATTTGGGATTTTGGGAAPVVYPSATVAAAAEEVDETVIPDDAVPAAGQTRTTRTRRTAANNAVAEEETTTIDEAETPLAGGDADDAVVEDTEDTTTVEEDLVPLAGEAQKGFFARTWWGWLLLIIAVLTGSTAYAKKKADAKKVK